ncbi:MAG: hypothetical protein P1V81_18025 [Planctomycetota bacterium]|nr:hypothetical protein [Planctomycetota bacterium]
MSARVPTARGGLLPLVVGVIVALGLGLATSWLCDDAFISFRYARHLAEGHGLVFNVGETPPIEAYSNLAWVLVLALGERIGIASPTLAPLLSLGTLAWLVGLVARDLGRWTSHGPWSRLALVLIQVGMPPLVVWGTSGLETMAFTLAVYQVARHLVGNPHDLGGSSSIGLAIWVSLVVLLRVDGWVYLAGLIGTGSVVAWSARSRPLGRRLLVLVLSAALAIGLGLAVRWLAHGTLVPHTVRVKVEPNLLVLERGVRYILAMCLAAPALGLLQLLLLGQLRRGVVCTWALVRRRAAPANSAAPGGLVLAAPPLVALLASLMVGGDFMAFGRFFVPATPFLVVLLALWLERLGPARAPLVLGALTPLLLWTDGLALTDRLPLPRPVAEAAHFRWNDTELRSEAEVWRGMRERAKLWSNLGRALARHTEPGETLVVGAIGAVGYYSKLYLLDTYGLVDLDVGLAPGNPGQHSPGHDKQVLDAYFLPRGPDYYTGTSLVHRSDPLVGIPAQLLEDPLVGQLFELEFHDLEGIEDTQLRLVRVRKQTP